MTYRLNFLTPITLEERYAIINDIEQRAAALGMTVECRSHAPSADAKRILGGSITCHKVRLVEPRSYCGNHPNACELNQSHAPARHKALEGADWARFNDAINHCLNDRSLSVDVSSSQVVIRKGRLQRLHYGSYRHPQLQEWVWDKDGTDACYADYCGRQAPPSTVPDGTPGQRPEQSVGYAAVS